MYLGRTPAGDGDGGTDGGVGGLSGGWCDEGWRLFGECSSTQRIINDSLCDDFDTPRAMRAMVRLKECHFQIYGSN